MTKDEALKLALEALEYASTGNRRPEIIGPAITAIKKALAQPEQEPFGYFQYSIRLDAWVQNRENNKGAAFYTTPPQRPAEPDQEPVVIPREDSQEAANAIQATLSEYQYPTNPTNAARAGWRAARLYTAPPQRQPLTDEQVKAIAYVGPVYAPDGVVTRSPLAYRKELEQHRMDAIRRTEAAHNIGAPK